jgi:hypothetical protein
MIRFLMLLAQLPDQVIQLPELRITGIGVGSQQEDEGRVGGRSRITRLGEKPTGRCLGKSCHPVPQQDSRCQKRKQCFQFTSSVYELIETNTINGEKVNQNLTIN